MKFLLVDQDEKSRHLISIYLENIFDETELIYVKTRKQAIQILESEASPFDLILCDYHLKEGTGGEVYQYLKKIHSQVPFVFLSSEIPEMHKELANFFSEGAQNYYLSKPLSQKDFQEKIWKILGAYRPYLNFYPAFKKVRLVYFWRFNKVLCDVFVKLSDRKYVKAINKNEVYNGKDIGHFKEKGIDYLYIKNEDFDRFAVSFAQMPFLITDTEGMNESDLEDSLATTHAVMHELILNQGINEEVIELASKTVAEVIKLSQNDKRVGQLLQKVRSKKDYIYDHSYLVSLICSAICQRMTWCSDDILSKLCSASLFHDITLKNPELALIMDTDSPEVTQYSKEEMSLYAKHPEEAANLLKESKMPVSKQNLFNEDIRTIILQHHETIEGTGFPARLTYSRISPLSSTFIVAHDYVTGLYKYQFVPQANELILRDLFEKYGKSGYFQTAMKALWESFGKCPPKE